MLVFLVLECYMDMFTLFMIPVVYLKGGIVSHLSKKRNLWLSLKKKKKKKFFLYTYSTRSWRIGL